MKSEGILNYIETQFSEIHPGEALPCDMFLYFTQNQHILLWRKKGDLITDGFIDKYRQRGVNSIWVHKDDQAALLKYLHPIESLSGSASIPESLTMKLPDIPLHSDPKSYIAPIPVGPRTSLGHAIQDIFKSGKATESEKKEQVSHIAQEVIRKAATAPDQKTQKLFNLQAREIVQDVLSGVHSKAAAQVQELWRLANIDPNIDHGLNVSTYAVILAMAFGRIDEGLLADLALAGLVHDIGVSQVDSGVTRKPWNQYTIDMQRTYSAHVYASLDILTHYGDPEYSWDRVKSIILQHHEKFDGSGYPQKLDGFRIDDISQLLAIADILDSMSSGQWDGKVRTVQETFHELETIDRVRTFPEYFNPDLFGAIVQWIKDPRAHENSPKAIAIVESQTKRILKAA